MIKKIFYLIVLMLCVTSCSTMEIVNPIITDPEFTNQQITLSSFDFDNSFKTTAPISAEIWDESRKYIKFPNNFNIRLFEKTKEGWVELGEKPVTRLPPGDFVFDPINGCSCTVMISVFPDLPDVTRKYELRIYVSGLMSENNDEVEVVAYTDVTLLP